MFDRKLPYSIEAYVTSRRPEGAPAGFRLVAGFSRLSLFEVVMLKPPPEGDREWYGFGSGTSATYHAARGPAASRTSRRRPRFCTP